MGRNKKLSPEIQDIFNKTRRLNSRQNGVPSFYTFFTPMVLSLKTGSAYAWCLVLRAYFHRSPRWTPNIQPNHHLTDVDLSSAWSDAFWISIRVPPLGNNVLWGWALYESRRQQRRPKNWVSRKHLILQIYNNPCTYTLHCDFAIYAHCGHFRIAFFLGNISCAIWGFWALF